MPGTRDMLSLDEALAHVAERAWRGPAESVPVGETTGRILAAEALAATPVPVFTNSAMDGWAVRAADGGRPRRGVGESRAGGPWTGVLADGEALAISTGAVLPAGADAVVPRERVEVDGATVRVEGEIRVGDHVREAGTVIAIGDPLLPAGHRIAAHEIATLAGAGLGSVSCRRRPRVALLGSGDELRPAGEPLGPGQIPEANLPTLSAQIAAAGGELIATETVADDRGETEAAVARMLKAADILITTGGISVGPHDHFGASFDAAGAERIFWGVRIRPGSPLWFGATSEALILGLPGNPVSAVVGMHVFGRVLLGIAQDWDRRAPLAEPYPRATPRLELIRCRWGREGLVPLGDQASHAVSSLAADALAIVPEGEGDLPAGAPLAWMPFG